jgi:hypothetical protein
MPERLVDVLRDDKDVLRTLPVASEGSDVASEEEYRAKALELVSHANLLPDADPEILTARMHVSRGGPAVPYGDDRHILAGTRQGLEKVVRERAYFLWRQDGDPHGRAQEHWHRAMTQHLRERAYFLWRQDGCPEGRANEHWQQSCEFETYP